MWPATGPAPAAGGAAGLLYNLAVGQGLLQFGDARVGDLGEVEGELLQIVHFLEMHQPRVACSAITNTNKIL